MAKHNIIFQKDNEYYTPKEFVQRFGNFDYDPATTKEKAVETFKKYHNVIYILFPIEFMTTKRFHTIMKGIGFTLYLPDGRIKFQSGLGKNSSSPAFGSVVISIGTIRNCIEENEESKIIRIKL